jgi:hypothetical protein
MVVSVALFLILNFESIVGGIGGAFDPENGSICGVAPLNWSVIEWSVLEGK